MLKPGSPQGIRALCFLVQEILPRSEGPYRKRYGCSLTIRMRLSCRARYWMSSHFRFLRTTATRRAAGLFIPLGMENSGTYSCLLLGSFAMGSTSTERRFAMT